MHGWLAFAAVALAQHGPPSLLQFSREHVELTVSDGSFVVEGDYVFRRVDDGAQTVSLDFPFAGDGSVELLEVRGARAQLGDRRARLAVSFAEQEHETHVLLRYRQTSDGRSAGYVVTTALAWNPPPATAEFVVHAPAGWGPPKTAWAAPSKRCAQDRCDWSWSFTDFRPTAELSTRW